MIRQSRIPAGLILLLTAACAAGLVVATDPASTDHDDAALLELERAIADPNAPLETWFAYGRILHQRGKADFAAMAYQRVLETDPYHREANLHLGLVLAQTRQDEANATFVRRLILHDPRLAVELLGRPECQPLLALPVFQDLAREARFQAMD